MPAKPQPDAATAAKRFQVCVPAMQLGQRLSRQVFSKAPGKRKVSVDELTLAGLIAAGADAMLRAALAKPEDMEAPVAKVDA